MFFPKFPIAWANEELLVLALFGIFHFSSAISPTPLMGWTQFFLHVNYLEILIWCMCFPPLPEWVERIYLFWKWKNRSKSFSCKGLGISWFSQIYWLIRAKVQLSSDDISRTRLWRTPKSTYSLSAWSDELIYIGVDFAREKWRKSIFSIFIWKNIWVAIFFDSAWLRKFLLDLFHFFSAILDMGESSLQLHHIIKPRRTQPHHIPLDYKWMEFTREAGVFAILDIN